MITCVIGANCGFHRLISDLMQSMYDMSVMNTAGVCGLAILIAISMIYNKISEPPSSGLSVKLIK